MAPMRAEPHRARAAFGTILALLAGCGSTSQKHLPEESSQIVERILERALTEGETWSKLQELCGEAPHRLSGSEGAQRAVEWALEKMRADGLENVRLEPCTVPRWERGQVEELTLLQPEAGERLPILALGGSVATPAEGVEGELFVVDGLEELERLGDAVHDRIVLLNDPMSATRADPFRAYGEAVGQRVRGASVAARFGARAVLVRSMTTRLDHVPHTGALRYDPETKPIPAAAVSTLGAERLARLAARETVRLRLRLDCRSLDPVPSFNVVGEWVGRELPEEIVLVGGHLDAWDVGQGAHDCGAGCCQSMEALRLLRSLGLRPRRTLRAVLFMNEENGRAGGRAYREAHQGERHVLALESDRGAFTPRGFTTDAEGEARLRIEAVAGLLEEAGAGTIVSGGGGADIEFLAQDGAVLVGYLPDPQRYFDLHHSERDTLDAIHPRELELGTAAMAAMIYLVADWPTPWPVRKSES